MGIDFSAIKDKIKNFLAKGVASVAKLLLSKLLPKAEEKYCEMLTESAQKITEKVFDKVEDFENETNTTKKIRNLYILRLLRETLEHVGNMLLTSAEYIANNVDFTPLTNPSDEEKIALAEIPGAVDSDGGCGEDGCEIA